MILVKVTFPDKQEIFIRVENSSTLEDFIMDVRSRRFPVICYANFAINLDNATCFQLVESVPENENVFNF